LISVFKGSFAEKSDLLEFCAGVFRRQPQKKNPAEARSLAGFLAADQAGSSVARGP